MTAFIYLVVAISPSPPSLLEFLQTLGIFTLASLGIGTFGQLLNDLTDVVQDVRTGAQNLVARKGLVARWLLFGMVVSIATLPWICLPTTTSILVLLAVEFLLFGLYSIPPFRLKNRGILGPVADALYGYVVPNVVAMLVFAKLGGGMPLWLVVVIAVWAFFFGLERIINHQLVDASRDHADGVNTFVVVRGWASAFGILHRIIVPLAIISCVLLLVGVGWYAPLVPLLFIIHVVICFTMWVHGSLASTLRIDRLTAIDQVSIITDLTISGFVWRWLPIISLLTLASTRFEYLWLVPMHLVLFPEPLLWLWREFLPAFPRILRGKSKCR